MALKSIMLVGCQLLVRMVRDQNYLLVYLTTLLFNFSNATEKPHGGYSFASAASHDQSSESQGSTELHVLI
ncbi:hypothetical protein JOM56_013437 [Amanita muscaria]